MHNWALPLLPVIFFGLSMIGIVLGWISWDQSLSGGKPMLDVQMVHLAEYLLAFITTILVTVAVWAYGSPSPIFAMSCGLGAGFFVFVIARVELH
jgi:hypothetical protein